MNGIKSFIYNLIRSTEKYFKTDMIYLSKGGFWIFLGQIISSVLVLSLTIVFANLLTQEEYGIYRYALSILGLLGITTLNGINQALVPAIVAGYEKTALETTKIRIKWGLWGTFIAFCMAGYNYVWGNQELTIILIIIGVFAPVWETLANYDAVLHARKKFNTSTIYSSILNIGVTLLTICTVFFTKNIPLIILIYIGSYTFGRAIISSIVYRKEKLNNRIDLETITYGKHLSIMNAVVILSQQIDKIMLFQYLGPVQLAIYSYATAPVEQVRGITKSISTLVVPKFSEKNHNSIKESIRNKRPIIFFSLLFIVIAYIIAIPLFYKIALPQYIESIAFSQIFSISLLGIGSSLAQVALLTQKKQKDLYIYNIFNSLFSIIITIISIIYFGLWGAIIAKTISYLINAISLEFLVETNFPQK